MGNAHRITLVQPLCRVLASFLSGMVKYLNFIVSQQPGPCKYLCIDKGNNPKQIRAFAS